MNKEELELLTVSRIQEIAKEMGIGSVSTFNKEQLVIAVLNRQEEIKEKRDRLTNGDSDPPPKRDLPPSPEKRILKGLVDLNDRNSFVRVEMWLPDKKDLFLPQGVRQRFSLRTGDLVEVSTLPPREGKREKFSAVREVLSINGEKPDIQALRNRPIFEKLTPIYPNQRVNLETTPLKVTSRILDIIAPIGLGQRAMVVSPPKAGKTTILKDIADSIAVNHPEIVLMALLIDERPEEVTDFQRSIQGEVIASTFDEKPENHTRVAEAVSERAKRIAESGKDVVILLDSITRLARAYNLTVNSSGRTLSGGLDPASLYKPKRFFGSARKIEGGGSLTIVATALVDTGSKLDDIIYEEFKGTGNMEVHLDRGLANRRLFPAIDVNGSSTRHEELLFTDSELPKVWRLRRILAPLDGPGALELLLHGINGAKTNDEFLNSPELARG
ncbi:transcription termination factor Rho [bacterium]|nr:transcription termination factor Rho [bacterium]